MSRVIELVLFETNDGISDKEFIAAAQTLNPILGGMSGYLGRELCKTPDGTWADIVQWNSLAEAQAAAEAIMNRPEATPFMSAINTESMQMMYLDSKMVDMIRA